MICIVKCSVKTYVLVAHTKKRANCKGCMALLYQGFDIQSVLIFSLHTQELLTDKQDEGGGGGQDCCRQPGNRA